jgi:hypothetical protein
MQREGEDAGNQQHVLVVEAEREHENKSEEVLLSSCKKERR